MSVVTYAVCRVCKEKLWVGQGYTLYTGVPETMEKFRQFIREHIACDDRGITLERDFADDLILMKNFEGEQEIASVENNIPGHG